MEAKLKKSTIIVLILIIALSLARITYVFAFEKHGIHSDEIWGYAHANSYYERYIFVDDDFSDYKNINEWLNSDVFLDYITVQEGEQFSYGSIYHNIEHDLHAPLELMILHTICSFFPNSFSLWYGFIINMVSFVVMMIFAFRLGKLMTNSEFFALAFSAFYAFCDGTLNNFVFIRMYSMVTAIFMALLFFTFRLMKTRKMAKNIIPMAICVFLGSLTHHYFMLAAGALIFFVSIYFLLRKQFKIMIINGLSMLLGVALSIGAFPYTIDHLMDNMSKTGGASGGSGMPPLLFSFKSCIHFTTSELFGITVSPYRTMTFLYIGAALILLVAVFGPILFLVRRNEWVKTNIFGFPKRTWNFFKTHAKTSLAFSLVCVLTTVVVWFVTAKTVNVMYMELHTDRYLFVIFPALAIAAAYIVYELLIHIVKKPKFLAKSVFCVILAVCVLVGNFKFGCIYLFNVDTDTVELHDVVENSDVIIALSRAWTITCYPQELTGVNSAFVTNFDLIEGWGDEIAEKIDANNDGKPLYLAINSGALYEDYQHIEQEDVNFDNLGYAMFGHDKDTIMNFFKNLKVAQKFEYVGQDSIFEEVVDIYKLRD